MMTVHVLHAGDGYTYLTGQVASGDVRREKGQSLSDYYLQHGNPPGRWVGAGLAALEVSGEVSEQQMKALFGQGLHPDADVMIAVAMQQGASPEAALKAARLGRRFPVFQEVETDQYPSRLAAAYKAFALEHDRAPEAGAERDELRWSTAVEILTERGEGRAPSPADVAHYLSTRGAGQRQAVSGYDLVFTPVKSVSTLWALGDDETREAITQAHHDAWRSAFEWVQSEAALTRVGAGGVAQIETNGLVATAFDHLDSRTGDPNLHTHVAVATKVQGVDGGWRSLDGRVLHALGVAASERYNTAIEDELRRRLGVRFVPEGREGKRPVREIVGIAKEVRTAFSQRRGQVEAEYDRLMQDYRTQHGREAPRAVQFKLAQQATLATRTGKDGASGLEARLPQWRATAAAVLGGRRRVQAMVQAAMSGGADVESEGVERAVETVDDLAQRVLENLGRHRSTWNRWHIAAESERVVRASRWAELAPREAPVRPLIDVVSGRVQAASTQLTPEDLNAPTVALQRSNGESIYRQHGSEVFTSAAVLAAEDRLLLAAQSRGGLYVDRENFAAALETIQAEKGRELNVGQRALAAHFAGSGRRLAAGIGPAGTGKTTAMSAFARAVELQGGRVLGLAPSAAAAAVLGEELGVPADTLHKLIHTHRQGGEVEGKLRIDADTVLLVDEAGMAGTTELAEILALAERHRASVRLLGDPSQLAAVGSGGALRLIDHYVGAAQLEEVHRFRLADGSINAAEARASLQVRDGDVAGLTYYLENDRARGGVREAMIEDLYTAWSADMAAGENSIMVAPTNDVVVTLNTRARADRIEAGLVRGADVELHDGSRASTGDVIVTRRNNRRLRTGPSDYVKNGDLWRVTRRHRDGSLSAVHRETNASVTLPAEYVAEWVELGYAATTHRVQGMTVDTGHGLVEDSMSRNQLYTLSTRGRSLNRLYVVTDAVLDVDLHHKPDPASAVRDALEAVLARQDEDLTAFEALATEWDQAHSLAQLVPAYEDAYSRLLEPGARERIAALVRSQLTPAAAQAVLVDPAYPQLEARLLEIERTEQRDVVGALARAVAADERPIEGARSPARVLRHRLGESSATAAALPKWVTAPPTFDDDPTPAPTSTSTGDAALTPSNDERERPTSETDVDVDVDVQYERAATITDAAWQWWTQQAATDDAWAPGYLEERRLAGALEVGWAPPSWDALVEHLRAQGHRDDDLLTAGVATRTRDGRLIDRFRDRLVIPVRDGQGRVVGVSARRNPTVTEDSTPKYINTPATPAYDKSRLLLGWSPEAAERIADGATVVFVEGAMDAAAISSLGRADLVPLAPCGTALTDEQLDLVREAGGDLRRRAIFAFDGDQAGQTAAARAWSRLTPEEAAGARHLQLPPGSDPADLVARDQSALLAAATSSAGSLTEGLVDQVIASADMSRAESRVATARAIATAVARLPQDLYLDAWIATRLGDHLDPATVGELLEEARTPDVDVVDEQPVDAAPGEAPTVPPDVVVPARDVDAGVRDWLTRQADLIEDRLDALVADVEGPTPPLWASRLYRPPSSPQNLARWRTAVRSVAAYRDRYAITGSNPLGRVVDDGGTQQRAYEDASTGLNVLTVKDDHPAPTPAQEDAIVIERRRIDLERVRRLGRALDSENASPRTTPEPPTPNRGPRPGI